MYFRALPPREQGTLFAINQVNTLHQAWDAIAATPPSADDDQRRGNFQPR